MPFNKDEHTNHIYFEREITLSVRIKSRDLSSLHYLEQSLCYLLGETTWAKSVNPDSQDNSLDCNRVAGKEKD